ncbi:MAG: nitroreductase family protein [Promethearchaeota archaeon]
MLITGIDQEKCTLCGLCREECITRFFINEQKQKIEFQDPDGSCMRCGHCIAVCLEDAILYEGTTDKTYSFEEMNTLEEIISYDAFYKFARAHRSIRHYEKKPISPELLKKVVDVMQYAPTGRNMRTEMYTIVSGAEKLKELSDAALEVISQEPMMGKAIVASFEARKSMYDVPFYYDAPHLVIVSSAIDLPLENYNIGISVTYGRIAAQSLGLGTCWSGYTQLAAKMDKNILKIAGAPGSKCGAFTIGYPAIKYQRCPPRTHRAINGLEDV